MLPLSARRKLLEFLEEDWSKGDVTGDLIEEKTCSGVFSVKEPCVLAGLEETAFLFEHEGVEAKALAKDGTRIAKKSEVLRVRGSNKKLIAMARTALDGFGRRGFPQAGFERNGFAERLLLEIPFNPEESC